MPSFEDVTEAIGAKPTPTARSAQSRPAKRGGSSALRIAILVAAIGGGGYAIYRLVGGPSREAATPSSEVPTSAAAHSAAPSVVEQATAPSPLVSSTVAAQSAAPTSSAEAPSSAAPTASSPPLAPVTDVKACFVGLLAAGAVAEDAHPDFSFICKDVDPRKASGKVKSMVVAASHGHVTDAMREWSMMGYWELATYAAMRGRCCPNARPLEIPPSPGACPSLADALNAISAAAHPGVTESAQADAAKNFHDALRCVVKSGQEKYLGDFPPIAGGQDTAFMKTFQRTRL
jgi:hypothetical protein